MWCIVSGDAPRAVRLAATSAIVRNMVDRTGIYPGTEDTIIYFLNLPKFATTRSESYPS